ncbi:MAG: ABC transporter permease [Actinomycetota bacterium]|nr:ABC transporter permease [Actinomycetota bacterium]
MVPIAFKNLFHERTRLILAVAGIAFAVVLILILEGFSAGVFEQAAAYPKNSGAELFVIQDGVDGMQSARSIIPQSLESKLAQVKGVKHVAGVFAAPIMFEHRGLKTPVILIGYRLLDKMGGPWKLDSGRAPRTGDEVVLDLAMAQRNNISLGDKVEILGKKFKVVGLSRETTSWMNPYVFIVRSEAVRLLSAPGSVSYFLIHLKSSADLGKAKRQTKALVDGYDVLTAKQLANNDTAVLEDIMEAPLKVMVTIAYIIGTLVIGLTVYTAVFAKLREYGVIKAIGGANRQLYLIVIKQAIILTVLGFVFGTAFSFAVADRIVASYPQFFIAIDRTVILRTGLVALIMGLVASIVPIRKISGVDPMSVFRG